MPYIKIDKRQEFDEELEILCNRVESPGELNYLIMRLCCGSIGKVNYNNLNDIIGVLECVKQEIYRRLVIPYEDEKMAENGDIRWS